MLVLVQVRILWAWLRPVLSAERGRILAMVLPLAKEAIMAHSGLDMLNADKKTMAMDQVLAGLQKQGVNTATVSSSLIELGFNLAFQNLRSQDLI